MSDESLLTIVRDEIHALNDIETELRQLTKAVRDVAKLLAELVQHTARQTELTARAVFATETVAHAASEASELSRATS